MHRLNGRVNKAERDAMGFTYSEVQAILSEIAQVVELHVPDEETQLKIRDGWARIPLTRDKKKR